MSITRSQVPMAGPALTFVGRVLSVVGYDLFGFELCETEVWNLDHPATVHQAVGGLEVSVEYHCTWVNITHPLVT